MAISTSTFAKLFLPIGIACLLLATPANATLLSGVAQPLVNSAIKKVINDYNLHNKFIDHFRHPTGDKRCNAEANSRFRIYWGQGIGSFVKASCNSCTAADQLKGRKCTNTQACSTEGDKVTKNLEAHARTIDNNADDYEIVQEAAKQTLEILIEVQLKYGAPLAAEKRLFSCVHSYAKEVNEDVIKTDDNGKLKSLYYSLIHKI